MTLAKCILSQNVRRVRVCKRHLFPARNRKVPNGEVRRLWRAIMLYDVFHLIHSVRFWRFHFADPL